MAPRSSSPTTWNEIFADIYADHGDCAVEALGHGVLLCLWSPLPDSSLAGQEHGQTIPLADMRSGILLRCKRQPCIFISQLRSHWSSWGFKSASERRQLEQNSSVDFMPLAVLF